MLTPAQVQRIILDTLEMHDEPIREANLLHLVELHGVAEPEYRRAMTALADDGLVSIGDGKVKKV